MNDSRKEIYFIYAKPVKIARRVEKFTFGQLQNDREGLSDSVGKCSR